MSTAAMAAPEPQTRFQQHLLEARARQDSGLLDLLSLVVILTGVLRNWGELCAADLAYLAMLAAASLGSLVWRRFWPASFARHRELPAVAFRIAVAASPVAWKITQRTLNQMAPYGGSSASGTAVINAGAYLGLLLFSSFAATGGVMALARPVSLWLHLPTQAAVMLLIGQHNSQICSTAVYQHPTTQQSTSVAYAVLTGFLHMVSQPSAAPALQHGAMGRCKAVLSLAEFLLGFLAPSLMLLSSESALFAQYHRRLLARQQQGALLQQRQQERQQAKAAQQEMYSDSKGKLPPAAAPVFNGGGTSGGGWAAGGSGVSGELEPFVPTTDTEGAAAAHVPAAARPAAPSLAQPGGWAARVYLAFNNWREMEPECRLLDAINYTLLLLGATWQAIILLTPL